MTKRAFQFLFMAMPVVFGLITPLIFEMSNLIWGSVFGIGLCLGAFADGGLFLDHRDYWGRIGFFFDMATPLIIFLLSGWLWSVISERGRKNAVFAMFGSFMFVVPVGVIARLDELGIHFPDLGIHMASAY